MATTVNEQKTITLLDGSTIEVRPLKISLLRSFMGKFEEIGKVADNNEASMSLLMECVAIAMKQYKPELAADVEGLEEILDLPTVYRIVEEASGVKLTDTPLLQTL